MRKAAKLLSILTVCSMCLTTGAHAYAAAPLPDPRPPVEDTAPAEEAAGKAVVIDGEYAALESEDLAVPGADPLAGSGEGYVNTPDAPDAAAPPWPLGVNGSCRAIRLTGPGAGLSLVRSDVSAGGWGVLGTDPDSACGVTAVDSHLRVLSAGSGGMDSGWEILGYDKDDYGSGYGAYLTGGASAYFYGSDISGATYGAVLNGADRVWFGSSDGTVLLYDGPHLAGSVRGRGQTSAIDSVFGLMMCGDAERVTVEAGTAIRAAEAAVLYKDGSGALAFNNARLSSDSGVLFQMMDNDDDDRIGLLTDTYGYSPVYDEANTGGGPGFPTIDREIVEAVSPKLDDPDALPPTAEAQHIDLSYTYGLYAGNIYNGTGYYGQPGDSLSVTVGRGAVLDGDISLTSTLKAIPYSEQTAALLDGMDDIECCLVNSIGAPCQADQAAYIQFLRYTIGQYYLQGHVQNLPYCNGSATLDVTVAQDGVWAVKDVSVVTSLTVEDGALVYGQVRENADGSVTLLPADQSLEPGVYASDAAAFAPAENGAEQTPDDLPPRQTVVTIAGQEYTLDVYERDGTAYVRLSDLIALFFGGVRPPSI